MNSVNDTLIAFLSVMSAAFALHLVLKRDQTRRRHEEQRRREIAALTGLKDELETNLQLCRRILNSAAPDAEKTCVFKTSHWREQGGSFPLSREELAQNERAYDFFEAMNGAGSASGHFSISALKNGREETEKSLRIVDAALSDLRDA
ncbi:MAG: hypothetical protein ACE5GQ_09700 [Nitrospinales bacterium]